MYSWTPLGHTKHLMKFLFEYIIVFTMFHCTNATIVLLVLLDKIKWKWK